MDDDDEIVRRGVELLAHLEDDCLDLATVIDRIELVTDDPRLQRQILDAAAAEGVIERDSATIRPVANAFVRFGADVVSKEGEFTCRRCGSTLTTGYFISFQSGEFGPFGSSCIRRVTGRE